MASVLENDVSIPVAEEMDQGSLRFDAVDMPHCGSCRSDVSVTVPNHDRADSTASDYSRLPPALGRIPSMMITSHVSNTYE